MTIRIIGHDLALAKSQTQLDRNRMAAFHALDREHQEAAIRRLAAIGMTEAGIATATKLSIEMVRRILANNTHFLNAPMSARQLQQEI